MADGVFGRFLDERGSLLPIELDQVPFDVRRLFVVHGSDPARARGDHHVPCEQLVVLLSGSAGFTVAVDGEEERTMLGEPGSSLWLRPGVHVSYLLDGPASAILVLASAAYEDER